MSVVTGDSQQRVLAAIRDAGAATVSELADTTGLSRPTVESALGRLERERLVRTEAAVQSRGSGRPARVSTFLASAGAVAGVDLTGERARIVVSDLAGGLLTTSDTETASPTEGRSDLQPIVELLDRTLLAAGLQRGQLRAIGVGIPGLVRADGVLGSAPEVSSWQGRNMRDLFTETFGIPAAVDNDLTLAATAEARSGALAHTDVGVYALSWFHVSARTVINGSVLRGRRSGAGEVGLLAALSDVKGPPGTLRSSLPAVAEALGRLRSNGEDREGIETLERLTTAMAPSIAALVLATDPDRVVLGGELSVFHDMIAPRLTTAIRDAVAIDVDVEVVPGTLGEHAVALGALHHAFSQLPHEIYGTATMTPPSLSTINDLQDATSAPRAQFSAALIGVGARAGLAKSVGAFDGAVVAAVDPDPATASVVADLFGAEVPLLADVTTLLRDFPGLDGAIVASPDDTHADIAVELLEAGVPVYLEKPLAITIEDCDRVLETAHRTGTKLYVGHNMRHMHVVRLMKEIIDRGEIGEVRAIWCRHFVGTGGDFYFKDWHADRSRAGSLLLQKGAHDIDVMHWLAGSSSRDVTGMGDLAIYGQISDRRDNSDRRMRDWFSSDNWPPLAQTELNPVVDVEDISMILTRLDSGAFISYQQCHFTPDYWRNYTVIGTEGRLENFGDGEGGEVRVWNKRSGFLEHGHVQYPIVGDANGHGDADQLTVGEFMEFVRNGTPTDTSPLSARDSVAAGIAGAESIRSGSKPVHVPEIDADVRTYFEQPEPAMTRYALRRIAFMVPTVIGSTLLVYLLVFLLPGDPVLTLAGTKRVSPSTAAAIRDQYNLNDPFFVQYGKYLGNVLHGNFGSDFNGNPVIDTITTALPYTVALAVTAFVLKLVIGILMGVWAGLRPGKAADHTNLAFTIVFLAVPGFLVAYLMQYVLGIKLGWLPISGVQDGYPVSFLLPALVLALETASPLARLTRNSLTEVLHSDYIQTARAKGATERRVLWLHSLRNAFVPIITYLGLSMASLLGGSVLVEYIFNLPGLGGSLAQAIQGQEGPVVVGIAVFLLLFYLVCSLVIDLLYPIIDPRVRRA